MSGLIAGLAGAGGAANTAGGYYQNAMNNEVNAYGSPAAKIFGREQDAALLPQFNTQNQQMIDRINALGLGGSGAGTHDLQDVTGQQSATLAGAIAPLYQQALSAYSNINSQMPGAQMNAYQNAINNFYAGLSDAGSLAAGLPPSAQPSSDPYATGTDAGYDNASQLTYSNSPDVPPVYAPPGGYSTPGPYQMSGDPAYA